MRVPTPWCSLALLATTASPLLAQAFPDDGPLAALSLAPTLADLRPPSPPPATQPVAQAAATPFFLDLTAAPAVLSPQSSVLRPLFTPTANFISEASLTWQFASGLPGQVKIGSWSETPERPAFPGAPLPNAWGRYLVLDQLLWRADDATADDDRRGLGLFLIYDSANSDLFPTTEHLSAGLAFKGLLPDRADDVLGLGLSYAYLTIDPLANIVRDTETAVEVFYKFQITPHLTVRPDVQYILDPASTHAADTVVASVRVEFEY